MAVAAWKTKLLWNLQSSYSRPWVLKCKIWIKTNNIKFLCLLVVSRKERKRKRFFTRLTSVDLRIGMKLWIWFEFKEKQTYYDNCNLTRWVPMRYQSESLLYYRVHRCVPDFNKSALNNIFLLPVSVINYKLCYMRWLFLKLMTKLLLCVRVLK